MTNFKGPDDQYFQWLTILTPEECKIYKNKAIGIHPKFGIICVGNDISSLISSLARRNIDTSEITFGYVPGD